MERDREVERRRRNAHAFPFLQPSPPSSLPPHSSDGAALGPLCPPDVPGGGPTHSPSLPTLMPILSLPTLQMELLSGLSVLQMFLVVAMHRLLSKSCEVCNFEVRKEPGECTQRKPQKKSIDFRWVRQQSRLPSLSTPFSLLASLTPSSPPPCRWRTRSTGPSRAASTTSSTGEESPGS